MKILHITDTLCCGGKERQLSEFLKWSYRIPEIQCELAVLSHENHFDFLSDLDIPTYYFIRKYKYDFSIFFKYYILISKNKFDIIHSWSSICSIYALPSIIFLPVKFINGFLRNAPQRLPYFDKEWRRSKLSFFFSDIIFSNSSSGLKVYNVPQRKAVYIHNGFNFNRLNNLSSKNSIRKKYNIYTKYVVGMVANFTEKKDHFTFIQAAQMILNDRDDVSFILVGSGKLYETINQLILPWQENKIKLVGKCKRVIDIINIFDVGVLTTFSEGISNTIMEYMALSKPVVVTDCYGTRELVDDQINGIIIDSRNASQLKIKINLLLNDNYLSKYLGKNAFEKIYTKFNLSQQGELLLKLYKSLLL